MKKRARRDQGVTLRALKSMDGGSNTTLDIAADLKIPVAKASDCILRLRNDGIVKRTDRVIVVGPRQRYRVFEVVT
jgi:Mn-dependent DtxR family transcriptional regulator